MIDYGHNVPLNEYQIYRYVRYSNTTLENIHLRYKSFIECTFSDLSFIGWKRLQSNIIAKLEIPTDARRVSGFSRKCRAECALVLGFYNPDGTEIHNLESANSLLYSDFTYTLGKMAYADGFDAGRDTRGKGIHFFLSFHEAVEYGQP